MNVELGSTREAGENTLEVACVSKMEKCMIPEQLPSTGNLQEQWARFKNQLKQFLDASEKSEALDKAKIAMLLRTIGDKGNDIFYHFSFEADAQPTFVRLTSWINSISFASRVFTSF